MRGEIPIMKNAAKKSLTIIITSVFLLVSVLAVLPVDGNAASLKTRAKKAYKTYFSNSEGYYAYAKIKGCKAPVFLYAESAYDDLSGKDRLITNACQVFVYKKGKVKRVKDPEHLCTSNTTSTEISVYKRKISITAHASTRELYISGTKLKGQAVFFDSRYMKYYKYKVKNSKPYGKKRISKKSGKKFMDERMEKAKTIYFKEINW